MKSRQGIALLALLVVAVATTAAAPASVLRFVDDREEAIDEALEVCWRMASDAESCRAVDAVSPVAIPHGARAARVEGPRHGPTEALVETLPAADRLQPLVVPRKARLEVRVAQDTDDVTKQTLQLSLWDLADEVWRRPMARWDLDDEALWLPARGRSLVSVSDGVHAPILRLVDLKPGTRHTVDFEARPGWSAVLRVRTLLDEQPVEGATVELSAFDDWRAAPADEPTKEPTNEPATEPTVTRRTSNTDGYTVASGLEPPFARVSVRHAEHLPSETDVVSAEAGSFAVHTTDLLRGATLEVTVQRDGEALAGARCRLLRVLDSLQAREAGDSDDEELVAEAKTSTDGMCQLNRLEPGATLLRITAPPRSDASDTHGPPTTEQVFELVEGETRRVNIDLERLEITGRVTQGDEPVSGLTLALHADEGAVSLGSSRPTARATTDEDGAYALNAWRAGAYRLFVLGPGGVPADFRRIELPGNDIADFDLAAAVLRGRVVDDAGAPVEGASLQLRWQHGGRSHRLARSDEDGAFSFFVGAGDDGPALATITARHPGLETAVLDDLEVDPTSDPPSLELVMQRLDRVTVEAQTPTGAPAAPLWALSFAVEPDGRLRFIDRGASTDSAVRLRRAEGLTRIVGAGAGCPLASVDLFDTAPDRPTTHTILPCPPAAHILLRFEDPDGLPRSGVRVLLRVDGRVVPEAVVSEHLRQLGLPTASQGAGQLSLPALPPGRVEIFHAGIASAPNLLRGVDDGRLETLDLAPGTIDRRTIRFALDAPR